MPTPPLLPSAFSAYIGSKSIKTLVILWSVTHFSIKALVSFPSDKSHLSKITSIPSSTRAVAKESILSPFADLPLHCYREDNTGVPIFYPHNMLCSAHLQYDTQIYLQLQSLYAQFHKKGVRPRFLTNTMCNRAVHLQIPM